MSRKYVQHAHIVDVLCSHAADAGDRPAFTFLAQGEHPVKTLSYETLVRRARTLAEVLSRQVMPQSRALLVYPSGLDFIEALWACFFARIIAVPAYSPHNNPQRMFRLRGMIRDCGPELVLCNRQDSAEIQRLLAEDSAGSTTIVTDEVPEQADPGWHPELISPEDIALLQYSSGSTRLPRGVMVSHGNILANQLAVKEAFRHSQTSIFVGWLPFFHDMGLFGQVIQPLFLGTHSVLMSPTSFIQKPVRWLRAISHYRAHTSGGPNFAFEYCTRKVTEEEKADIDLTCWKRAFNGAEKPRPDTMRRFSKAFSSCGFQEDMFYPCYGLAESVLFVTGRDLVSTPHVAQSLPLSHDSVKSGMKAISHASSGRSWLGHRVAIVDQELKTLCPEGNTGEIWISGPSVARGYWGNPSLTNATFNAFFADGNEGPFLRTGDLGFMKDGELFVVGRMKDLIIIRGQNYQPEDIEAGIESECSAVGPGQCAAFSIDGSDGEELVVLVEINSVNRKQSKLEEIGNEVLSAVSRSFGLTISHLLLVRRGTIPRTTSNKIQRSQCREQFLRGGFTPLARWNSDAEIAAVVRGGLAEPAIKSIPSHEPQDSDSIEEWLIGRVKALLPRDSHRNLVRTRSLVQNGLDSLCALQLKQSIEDGFGATLSVSELFQSPSIEHLAHLIASRLTRKQVRSSANPSRSSPAGEETRLSYGQQALLLEHEKAPSNANYNISVSVHLTGELNRKRLASTISSLKRKHPQLSAVFFRAGSCAKQRVLDCDPCLEFVDAHGWTAEELTTAVNVCANSPFDLAQSVFRVRVFAVDCRTNVLLLVAHHIVIDLMSLELLLHDLVNLYAEFEGGHASIAAEPVTKFADYVSWEAEFLESAEASSSLQFWRDVLAKCPPAPGLPFSYPPSVRAKGAMGAVHYFDFSPDLVRAIHEYSARQAITPASIILAAYAVLLAWFLRENQVVVGVSVTSRPDGRFSDLVGYFANILPLPFRWNARTTFQDLTGEVEVLLRRALDHRHLPFSLLASKLASEPGSQNPLVRFAFTYGTSHYDHKLFGLWRGDSSTRVAMGPLVASGFPLQRQMVAFDLTLMVLEADGSLEASFDYDEHVLDSNAVRSLSGTLQGLVKSLIEFPEKSVSDVQVETKGLEHSCPAPGAPTQSVLARFLLHAASQPDAVALAHDELQISYAELADRADKLGSYLREREVGPETVVAIHCSRGINLIVAILGTVKAGAVYLPIEINTPRERLRFLLNHSGASFLITESAFLTRFDASAPPSVVLDREWSDITGSHTPALVSDVEFDQAAYLIYTSGSTGKPKGVVVSHSSLGRLFDNASKMFEFQETDTWTLFHSISFDFSVWEMWGALVSGGRLIVLDHATVREPKRVYDQLQSEQVSILNLTPSALYNLLPLIVEEHRGELPALRYTILGGEALKCAHLREWFAQPGPAHGEIINMYGITETTVHTTWLRVRPELTSSLLPGSPIGRPLPDVQIYALGPTKNRLPAYIPGEIGVSGAGLARGYWRDPKLTALRFIPNPFGVDHGTRLYLSGDLAYQQHEEDFVYMGRIDSQVKVRGHRIEPREIEMALQACPEVSWAMVAMIPRLEADEEVLTAYLVCGKGVTVVALREHLAGVLPGYMMPSRFVRLPNVLTNENGKADLVRLRSHIEPLSSGETFRAPRNELEQEIANIWAEVLGVKRVGIDDNYFVLGGDSIRSIQIVSRTRALGVSLDVERLFTRQTISKILDENPAPDSGEPQIQNQPFDLITEPDRTGLPNDVEDAFPMSPMLQGLLFHSQISDDYQIYVSSIRVAAPWNSGVLKTALHAVVVRHPFLRSSFDTVRFSQALQLVHRNVDVHLSTQDISGKTSEEQKGYIRALIESEKEQTFDWSQAPLLRFMAVKLSPESFELILSEPYLDGWCVATLFRELVDTYDALLSGKELPYRGTPKIGQRQMVELEAKTVADNEAGTFWKMYLENAPKSELCRVHYQPGRPSELHRRSTLSIDPTTFTLLDELARRLSVPLRAILLAVHGFALWRLLEQQEIIFGVISNGRPEGDEGELAIGSFLNTVPIRVAINPEKSWSHFIHHTFEQECATLRYRRYPYAELKKLIGPALRFDTIFNFTHFHTLERLMRSTGCRITDMDASEQTYFPLTVHFNRPLLHPGLELRIDYDCRQFSPPLIAAIGEGYLQVLRSLAETSNAMCSLHTYAEIFDHCVFSSMSTMKDSGRHPLVSIGQMIGGIAAGRPDAIALVGEDGHTTYAQLQASAHAVAKRLRGEIGVGPGDCVGIYMASHSVEAIVAILATFEAGGAYVPLDDEWPLDRIKTVVRDCRPKCILAEDELLSRLIDLPLPLISAEDTLRGSRPLPGALLQEQAPDRQDAAYVIYTSGSTGTPKGIVVEHQALSDFIVSAIAEYAITPTERILQFCKFASDLSVEEIFMTLCAGAALVLRPRGLLSSYDEFRYFCRQEAIGCLDLPTAFWSDWAKTSLALAEPFDLPVRLVIIGGDRMNDDLASRWVSWVGPSASLVNTYGPTETTVVATRQWVTSSPGDQRDNDVTGSRIGKAFGAAVVSVADRLGRPVPAHVNGELYVGGRGVARGYHNRPALTAERFVPDPSSPGLRRFRTGDLAYHSAERDVYFLARLDLQVKIDGHRVELKEVESSLSSCPDVSQGVVIAEPLDTGAHILTAVVILKEGTNRDRSHGEQRIRLQLSQNLPRYMLPARLVFLETLPTAPSGKVDRRRLEQLITATPREGKVSDNPKSDLARRIADIWGECLCIERPLSSDNFFELGGNSLIAMRIASRIRTALSCDASVRDIFEHPQLEAFTLALHRKLSASSERTPDWPIAAGKPCLSFAQERLWVAEHLYPDSPSYNMPAVIALKGALNSHAFEQSIAEIKRRHSVLSMRLQWNNGDVVPRYDGRPIALLIVDLTGLSQTLTEDQIRGYHSEYIKTRFDLEHDAPIRVAIFIKGSHDFELAVAVHHVAADGWSVDILLNELSALYSSFAHGQPSPVQDLTMQYGDFARLQRESLTELRRRDLLNYWTRTLADLPEHGVLPLDYGRPAHNYLTGSRHYFAIDRPLAEIARQFSRNEGVSLFTTLMAAYKLLLHSYTGQTDIVVGAPVSNRDWPDSELLIGLFVNQLVIRTDLSGTQTYREVLRRVRTSFLSAHDHRDLPFDELVHAMHPRRSLSAVPLIQTIFAYNERPNYDLRLEGLNVQPKDIHVGAVKYDLEIQLTGTSDHGIHGYCEFNSQLFREDTIRELAERFCEQVKKLVQTPDSIFVPVTLTPGGTIVSESDRSAASSRAILAER
jgi:amino acid adenylation domain-containing protein